MGGCATKPKDLKDEFDKAPEPVPELVKEETSTVSEPKKIDGETKEIGEVKNTSTTTDGGEVEGEVSKVVDDGEVDEKGNKRKSLNSLLMETEIGKESSENEKPTQTVTIPSEPVKEAVKEVEVPKAEISIESSNTASIETEKKTESAPIVETVKPEISDEKKTVEAKEEPVATEKKDSDVVITKEEPVSSVPSAVEVKGDVAVTK
ncbi:hypothetical protein BVC80_1801g3 [Macleaya cordata]|uniref:Uncharacterized protein n=1 Tax=Macleaya cordata TaxID=56857 RepID=A0A200PMK1_MACCD|nr:hypothetical protein BVC80_1801g3 [Macleaya cordata]